MINKLLNNFFWLKNHYYILFTLVFLSFCIIFRNYIDVIITILGFWLLAINIYLVFHSKMSYSKLVSIVALVFGPETFLTTLKLIFSIDATRISTLTQSLNQDILESTISSIYLFLIYFFFSRKEFLEILNKKLEKLILNDDGTNNYDLKDFFNEFSKKETTLKYVNTFGLYYIVEIFYKIIKPILNQKRQYSLEFYKDNSDFQYDNYNEDDFEYKENKKHDVFFKKHFQFSIKFKSKKGNMFNYLEIFFDRDFSYALIEYKKRKIKMNPLLIRKIFFYSANTFLWFIVFLFNKPLIKNNRKHNE